MSYPQRVQADVTRSSTLGSTLIQNYTANVATSSILLVHVAVYYANGTAVVNPVNTVTFGGISLILVPNSVNNIGFPNIYLFTASYYLLSPTGTANIVISLSMSQTITTIIQHYQYVDINNPFDIVFTTKYQGNISTILNVPLNTATSMQTITDNVALYGYDPQNMTTDISLDVNLISPSPVIGIENPASSITTFFRRTKQYNDVRVNSNIKNMQYSYNFTHLTSNNYFATLTAITINGVVICLAGNTMVTMADGSMKPISDIKRGDTVYGNEDGSVINRVAKVTVTPLSATQKLSIVKINKDSLGENKPSHDLLMTDPHPLIWNGFRKPARCFIKYPGVVWHKGDISACQILPKDENGYAVYDLVFDHDGDYIANGMLVQAHSPWCHIEPLPLDLYFDPKNYREKRSWHCQTHPLAWNDKIVEL